MQERFFTFALPTESCARPNSTCHRVRGNSSTAASAKGSLGLALRAESAHEEGRKGVFRTKRWLESTTHIELNFDAYEWASECTVTCLGVDKKQTFDLKGQIYKTKSVLFVENKSYTTPGNQAKDYMDFLAIAYSATVAEIARTQDPRWEFMWVTTFPFAQRQWTKLTKRSQIKKALEADQSGLLDGQPIDEEVLDLLAERIWLLVLNKRQHDLTLSPKELSKIEAKLNRKGKS